MTANLRFLQLLIPESCDRFVFEMRSSKVEIACPIRLDPAFGERRTRTNSCVVAYAIGHVLEAAERISLLSQRMRQVLDALADGRLSKELAQPLGLSVRTVELHRARMLGVRTAAEAVRLLTLAKLIMPS